MLNYIIVITGEEEVVGQAETLENAKIFATAKLKELDHAHDPEVCIYKLVREGYFQFGSPPVVYNSLDEPV